MSKIALSQKSFLIYYWTSQSHKIINFSHFYRSSGIRKERMLVTSVIVQTLDKK